MDIHKLLSADSILVDLTVKKKDQLLNLMIDQLKQEFSESDLEELRSAVFDREKIMSTGVGKGLAIPHAKTKVAHESYAVFARLENPIEFNAIDGLPV
jgi:mannitol/fructose-specific phosphotransferase system IIA component (Ntr-type)